MIHGLLANWQRDKQFFPAVFVAAFAFVADRDVHSLADGKYPIDGERLFASVERLYTQHEGLRRFEVHRKYLDIQLLVTGREKHRYALALDGMTCTEDALAERDAAFYTPPASCSSLILDPGHYAVYFPGEPHAPCCAVSAEGEEICKLVFKVLWV